MPPATKYDPNDKDLRETANSELTARRIASDRAWNYYEGRHDKQLKPQKNKRDDNIVINLVEQGVDRVIAFLVPEFPSLEISETEETEDEAWLREAWEDGARLLASMAEFGSVDGHVFCKVLPEPWLNGEPIEPGESAEMMPGVLVLNPANVVVFWQADNVKRVLWYEIYWSAGKREYRQDIVREGQGWAFYDYARADDKSEFALDKTTEWPYSEAPIIDWQHKRNTRGYYGKSETGNLDLNNAVNRLMSDVGRILGVHASPKTIIIGSDAKGLIETAINNLWVLQNPDAQVKNLEMDTDLAASMGAVQYLEAAYFAQQRVVRLRGDVRDLQRVTNLGLRGFYTEQIAKNEELRRNYERAIQAISRTMQAIGRKKIQKPKVHWADPLPTDPMEQVSSLEKEREMGIVSQETAARERGRDWNTERKRMAEENMDAVNAQMMGEDPHPPTPSPARGRGGEGQASN